MPWRFPVDTGTYSLYGGGLQCYCAFALSWQRDGLDSVPYLFIIEAQPKGIQFTPLSIIYILQFNKPAQEVR
jgi:hypothetical protein